MIFINNATIYAKVWDIKKSDKYADLRISTSEKDKNGDYHNSNWFARAIGKAFNQLNGISVKDTVIISKAKLTNESYTDKDGNKKSSFKFIIMEFDTPKGNDSDTEEEPW